MKKLIFIVLLVVGCQSQNAVFEDFNALKEEFTDPSSDYRSAPLWVWNTKITQEDIARSLADLKSKGFGGVFIHPRAGLVTEYLSDDWFALYSYTVEKGKELDMNVWIYDENSYPSGFAGGHVPNQMPESYNEGAGLMPKKVTELPDDVADYYMVVTKNGQSYKDITALVSDYKGKKGEYILYEKTYYDFSSWKADHCYVDLLKKGVTEKFMEVTMSGYEKSLGAEFGKSVKGIFTDEPEIPSPGGLRWTADLFDEFENDYGYSLRDNLPAIHAEVGDYKRVRHDYYKLLLKLFIDRWSKPWYAYCDSVGLDWTGHYWEHGWPGIYNGPDNMAMSAWQQLPGIDMLFNQFNEEDPRGQFGNIRSVKEVASVANQLGRDRVLSETYGGAGWSITFKDMKRLADWQFVLGVNFVNQHIAPISIAGVRKQDYPPMFSPAAPWWDNYTELNDYNARVSAALTKGEQYNDILIIEPTTSIWLSSLYFDFPNDGSYLPDAIGNKFAKFITTLNKAMVEYDLGSEDVINNNGSISDGKFVVGKRGYSRVVIAPMNENIEESTFVLLKEFINDGGSVIAMSIPERISGKEDDRVKELFENPNVVVLSNYTSENIAKYFGNEDVKFNNKGGNLYHMRRVLKDGQLLFITNASMDESANFNVKLKGRSVVQMDPFTGEIVKHAFVKEGGNVVISDVITPAGSVLLFVSEDVIEAPKMVEKPQLSIVESSDKLSIKRVQDNVLAIDFLDLSVGKKTHKNIYFFEANKEAYRNAGFEHNPWFAAIQFKQRIVEKKFSDDVGFKLDYKFFVDNDVTDFSSFKIILENAQLYNIKLNNRPISVNNNKWLIDPVMKVLEVGAEVRKGENILEVSLDQFNVFAEIATAYVLGDFDVQVKNNRWVISKAKGYDMLSSWKDMRAPFFPWQFSYSKNYNISDTTKQYFVGVDNFKGILCEVYVNDQKAGIIYNDPYQLDISKHLKQGDNIVDVRVVGSLGNFIGPHHRKDDGVTSPWSWDEVNKRPSATEYIFTDYGLMKEFDVYSSK